MLSIRYLFLSTVLGLCSYSDSIAQPPSDSAVWSIIRSQDLYYQCSHDIDRMSSAEQRAISYSRIGADAKARRAYDLAYEKPQIQNSEKYYIGHGVDNVLTAIEKANPRIVILTEAHHQSHHRVVASAFLKDLFRWGYRHIAVEGLDPMDSEINDRGYPKFLLSGLYVSDPEYANFLRIAMRMDFELVAYDRPNSVDREYDGAARICDYMTEEDIDRLYVYCGYDHGRDREGTLAYYLAELLESDPFTILQTEHHGAPFRYDPSICDDTYSLFQRENNDFYKGENGDVDACLFSNQEALERRKYLTGLYIDYVRYEPLKRPYLNTNIHYPIQIRAMISTEGQLAIPVDIIEIKDRYHLKGVFLNLLKGYAYEINFYDCHGELIKTQSIAIPRD